MEPCLAVLVARCLCALAFFSASPASSRSRWGGFRLAAAGPAVHHPAQSGLLDVAIGGDRLLAVACPCRCGAGVAIWALVPRALRRTLQVAFIGCEWAGAVPCCCGACPLAGTEVASTAMLASSLLLLTMGLPTHADGFFPPGQSTARRGAGPAGNELSA